MESRSWRAAPVELTLRGRRHLGRTRSRSRWPSGRRRSAQWSVRRSYPCARSPPSRPDGTTCCTAASRWGQPRAAERSKEQRPGTCRCPLRVEQGADQHRRSRCRSTSLAIQACRGKRREQLRNFAEWWQKSRSRPNLAEALAIPAGRMTPAWIVQPAIRARRPWPARLVPEQASSCHNPTTWPIS